MSLPAGSGVGFRKCKSEAGQQKVDMECLLDGQPSPPVAPWEKGVELATKQDKDFGETWDIISILLNCPENSCQTHIESKGSKAGNLELRWQQKAAHYNQQLLHFAK